MVTVRLQTVWHHALVCLILTLIEFKFLNWKTGLQVTGQVEGSLAALSARSGILKEMNDLTWDLTEEEYRSEKIPISIVRPIDGRRINVPRRKEKPRRNILQIRVVKMQIEARIHARQKILLFEKTGISRLEYLARSVLFRMYFWRTVPPESLGVTWRILEVESMPMRVKFSRSFQLAAVLIGTLERSRCCPDWSSWPEDRVKEEFLTIVEVLSLLKDSLGIVMHQLHCRKLRFRWFDKEGKELGSWKDFLDSTGAPFGDGFNRPLKVAQASDWDIYTIGMFRELIQHWQEGRITRKFILDCILKYGIFLRPEDYVVLSRVVEAKRMKPDVLQKAAWLYHMNVPVRDMLLCVALMPLARDFPQARELAKAGVLPELLQELRSAKLLNLLDTQIRYIHDRCEEEGIERVMELLKAGLKPEYLRTALLFWDEFPGKSPSDITEAVLRNHSLESARQHLLGKKPEAIPALVISGQQTGRRRKRRKAVVPAIEMETAEAVQIESRANHVPASWFAGSSLSDVRKGLKKCGWTKVRRRRSAHTFWRKEGFSTLTLPDKHRNEEPSFYLMALAFRQASVEEMDARCILNH